MVLVERPSSFAPSFLEEEEEEEGNFLVTQGALVDPGSLDYTYPPPSSDEDEVLGDRGKVSTIDLEGELEALLPSRAFELDRQLPGQVFFPPPPSSKLGSDSDGDLFAQDEDQNGEGVGRSHSPPVASSSKYENLDDSSVFFEEPSKKRYRLMRKTKDPELQGDQPSSFSHQPIPQPASIATHGKRVLQISPYLNSLSRRIHTSHPLGHKRGVVWCWKCGSFAAMSISKLGQECSGGANRYGRACLSRLRRGLTPRSDKEWPNGGGTDHTPPDLAFVSVSDAPKPNNERSFKNVHLSQLGKKRRG